MNKLEKQLQTVKVRKKIGLMTHVVVGYPSLEDTVAIVKTMAESGVDFVELQIPFSDPLADGPTIMKACEESLKKGTKVKDAFRIMQKLSQEVSIPLLFMAYYNTVFRYGVERFCKDAAKAGASGLIVPDMPIEEEKNEHFFAFCKKYNIVAIHVVSPASTNERFKKNAKIADGFIYATARQGITGAKNTLDPKLFSFIGRLRKNFNIPIAIGFGISQKEHVESLVGHADVAIIGSKLIDVIAGSKKETMKENVKKVLQSFRQI